MDNYNSLTLVLNGKAADRASVRTAVQQLRSEGCRVDVRVTWEFGDAARYAASAARSGDSTVVAGGGDGTVNEVVCGIISSGAACQVGILPLGTANDFATSAGIPLDDPCAALRLAATGSAAPVDVGAANGRHFLNLASGGFGAEVTTSTPHHLKEAIGGNAYALTAMLRAMSAHPYRGRLITSDSTYEGAMLIMAVGNGRQAGGGAPLTPQALIDDGLFDVMIAPDHGGARFPRLLADLLELRHGESSEFYYLRTRRFRVEGDDELQFNLDGEPVRGRFFDFELLPAALHLVLPAHCPLLSRASLPTAPNPRGDP